MRHRDARNRLKQKPAHARMLKRNLVTSLLLYEEVRTTQSRAKAVQPIVDRLISTAKKKPAYLAIRSINKVVTDKNASRKLLEVLAKRYAKRSSGFTSAKPAGARVGDGAKLVDLVLLDREEVVPVEKAPKKDVRPETSEKPKTQVSSLKSEKKESKTASKKSATKKKPATKKKAS